MSGLPPGLEEFGRRLEQVAVREVEERRTQRQRTRRRTPRRWRSLGLPLTAALAAGAVSAGATGVVNRTGDPIEPDPGAAGAGQGRADATVVLNSAAQDPAGGPPWVLRAYADEQGNECVRLGRLQDGVFGQVQGGAFHALPASAPGTCAPAGERGRLAAFESRGTTDLTVVFGLAVDRTPVTVTVGEQERQVRPAGFGAFVTVFTNVDASDPIDVRSMVAGRVDVNRIR